MLLVDDIVLFPVQSILWISREISKIAHEELAGEAQSITEQLRLLYMQLETGRLSEEEFAVQETRLLDRLDALNDRLDNEDDEEAEESESDTGPGESGAS